MRGKARERGKTTNQSVLRRYLLLATSNQEMTGSANAPHQMNDKGF